MVTNGPFSIMCSTASRIGKGFAIHFDAFLKAFRPCSEISAGWIVVDVVEGEDFIRHSKSSGIPKFQEYSQNQSCILLGHDSSLTVMALERAFDVGSIDSRAHSSQKCATLFRESPRAALIPYAALRCKKFCNWAAMLSTLQGNVGYRGVQFVGLVVFGPVFFALFSP